MFECLILGDSVAIGTARVRQECAVYAQSGINSIQWNNRYLNENLSAKVVIISLGVNDHERVHTCAELEKMRAKIKGARVYWIMPAIKPTIQAIVKGIAEANGDSIILIRSLQPDNVHPTWIGYRDIAASAQ